MVSPVTLFALSCVEIKPPVVGATAARPKALNCRLSVVAPIVLIDPSDIAPGVVSPVFVPAFSVMVEFARSEFPIVLMPWMVVALVH